MKRIAYVLALVGTVVVAASCAQQPSAELAALRADVDALKQAKPVAPIAADEYFGDIELYNVGAACKIKSKSPDPIKVKAGSWVIWNIKNGCRQAATLATLIVGPAAGNRSKALNPLTFSFGDPIGPGETGTVVWKVKTKEQLDPAPGNTPDHWTYKWRLNNATQDDPELEVEYGP